MHPRRLIFEDLPDALVVMELGWFVNSLGTGFVLPFTAIYLHYIRHLEIGLIGLVYAASAAAGLVSTVVGARLMHRLGPQAVGSLGLASEAAGFVLYALAVVPPLAFLAGILSGLGNGIFNPAAQTLTAELTEPRQRTAATALQYAFTNLGIGLGAALAGQFVSLGHPTTFAILFMAAATAELGFAGILLFAVPRPEGTESAPSGGLGGYLTVLRDVPFLTLVAFQLSLVTVGYGQFEAPIPLYARVYLNLGTAAIGLAVAANTAFIVVAQLPVSRLARRLRRTTAVACVGLAWAAAWAVGLFASYHHAGAAWLVAAMLVVFGAGECMWSSSFPPLTMDMAPAASRGYYMSAIGLAWGVGLLLGPAVGTAVVGSPLHQFYWPILLASGLTLAVWALLLRRLLPRHVELPHAGHDIDPSGVVM